LLASVTLIPAEIRNGMGLFDYAGIRTKFLASPSLFMPFKMEYLTLIHDEILCDLIDSLDSIETATDYLWYFLDFSTSPRDLQESWAEKAIGHIRQLSVDSAASETSALATLRIISLTLSQFYQFSDEAAYVRCIMAFVSSLPYCRMHFTYSFTAFGKSSDFSFCLFAMLFRIDGIALGPSCDASTQGIDCQCSDSFTLTEALAQYFLNRCWQLLQLGLKEGARIQEKEALRFSQSFFIEDMCPFDGRSRGTVSDRSLPFLCALERRSFYDDELLASLMPGEVPLFYNGCAHLARPSPGFGGAELRFWTTHHCRIEPSLSLLMHSMEYERAYQRLMSIPDGESRSAIFVRSVVEIAIVFGHFESFQKFILAQDADLTITGSLFDSLVMFLSDRKMYHALVKIYGMMNYHEQAADCALHLYSSAADLIYRIYYLGCATICLKDAIRERETSAASHPPYRPTSRTLEDLRRRSAMVDLQQRLTNMCYHRNLSFSTGVDFITNPRCVDRGAAFFLFHGDERAVTELCRHSNLSTNRILGAVVGMFAYNPLDKVDEFITNYIGKHGTERYQLMCKFLAGLATSPHWELIALLIGRLGSDDREQCAFFCEFDWLFEALTIAVPGGAADLVPLIAYRASALGVEMVQKECERVLDLRERK
jgi:hypothetical protein